MPPVSFKKVAVVFLTIVALSRLDRIYAAGSGIYEFFAEALQPWREFSAHMRLVIAVALLALAYVTIFQFLHGRGKK